MFPARIKPRIFSMKQANLPTELRMTNIDPFSYKEVLFNMMESRVVTLS